MNDKDLEEREKIKTIEAEKKELARMRKIQADRKLRFTEAHRVAETKNNWTKHVRTWALEHNVRYHEALRDRKCSEDYHKLKNSNTIEN